MLHIANMITSLLPKSPRFLHKSLAIGEPKFVVVTRKSIGTKRLTPFGYMPSHEFSYSCLLCYFFFSETISDIYVASSGPKFRKPCTRANKIFGQHRADSRNKNLKRDQHTLPVTTNAPYKIIWWIEQITYLKNSWNPFSEKYLTTTGPQLTL